MPVLVLAPAELPQPELLSIIEANQARVLTTLQDNREKLGLKAKPKTKSAKPTKPNPKLAEQLKDLLNKSPEELKRLLGG